MPNCKNVLRHAVTGEVLLVCDLDDDTYHNICFDQIQGARWRPEFVGVGVTRLTPVPPLKEAAEGA